jgi:hypothetical protein
MLLENIYSTGITHADCHLQLQYFYSTDPYGQCYKDITIVNDTIGLSPQVVASPRIIIQTTLEVSLCSWRTFMVQRSLMPIVIYSCHIFIVQAPVASVIKILQL